MFRCILWSGPRFGEKAPTDIDLLKSINDSDPIHESARNLLQAVFTYYLKNIPKYEAQILKIIKIEKNYENSLNLHLSYMLTDYKDVRSEEITHAIQDLIFYIPDRLNNFQNDSSIVDYFFDDTQKWNQIFKISGDKVIIKDTDKLSRKSRANQSFSRGNVDSILYQKFQDIISR